MFRFACSNDSQFGIWLISRQVTHLGGSLTGDLKKDYCAVTCSPVTDIKQFILLFVDQIALVTAERMTEELIAAFCYRIFRDVEESLVVGGPGYVVYTFDVLRKHLAVAKIFYLQRILPVASVVSCEGKQISVVAWHKGANAHAGARTGLNEHQQL